MHRIHLPKHPGVSRTIGLRLLQAVAMASLLALALPVRAGDDRPVKTRIAPVYPEIAKRMHITGEVRLQAVVDADGKVTDVKPVSGNQLLEVAAEDAVRQWKFAPGDGNATVDVEVNFTLNQ